MKALKQLFIPLLLTVLLMTSLYPINGQDRFAALSYPYTMKTVKLDQAITIAYADEGKGEVILFVHGLGSYAPAWQYNVAELSKKYRCIVVDLPGYGKSSKGKYDASMSFQAAHLFALMDQLEIPEFHIAGHSMGGQIALTMALQAPGRIKSLLLMAPAGIETFSEPEKQTFAVTTTPAAMAAVTDEQYRFNLSINFYQMDERAEFMYSDRMAIKEDAQFMDYMHVLSRGVMSMLNEPVFELLPQIKQPILVVYGADDKLIPNKYMHPGMDTQQVAALAKQQMPQAEVHLVEMAGHFVHFEQPEQLNKLMMDFLSKTK
jgi:pimeloyl-ACP methyl ester carboxylesterase